MKKRKKPYPKGAELLARYAERSIGDSISMYIVVMATLEGAEVRKTDDGFFILDSEIKRISEQKNLFSSDDVLEKSLERSARLTKAAELIARHRRGAPIPSRETHSSEWLTAIKQSDFDMANYIFTEVEQVYRRQAKTT